MGTQQLLLIVLGVIIVGVAIAVGITIFNNQAYNANQQAVAQELATYGSMVIQWWKTPISQGGAGKNLPTTTTEEEGNTVTTITIGTIADAIGFTGTAPENSLKTETGTYSITGAAIADAAANPPTPSSVTLKGTGTEKKNSAFVNMTTTVNLDSGKITTVKTP